jgi:signal transduction histidine kinase
MLEQSQRKLPRAKDRWIEIAVTDTGVGIPSEDQERIFHPFEQADSSSRRRHQGTGLGLPLTKSLVELHGGAIWVESEGEGKGCTFTFIIPG